MDYRFTAILIILLCLMAFFWRACKMRKQCKQCEEAFDANDQFDMFCSKECKEEALADLDKDSDECLSCQ
jgi:hypothetical protein